MTNDKQRVDFPDSGENVRRTKGARPGQGRLMELLIKGNNQPCGNGSPWEDDYCKGCEYEGKTDCLILQNVDYLLANGVIVPPCKVGDVVYWIDNEKIKSCEVFEISIHSDGILIHTGIQFCLKPDTVFLTKEEAEQALKVGVQE